MQTQQKNSEKSAAFAAASILLGAGITLCLRGYQFAQSNQTIYLLDSLRRQNPNLLRNDWFLSHTLQYHTAFSHLSAWLLKIGFLQGGFFAGYVLLAVLLHIAWRRIVLLLGGTSRVYLLSVVFYYLSAAGFGLGMYDFLQDNSFLPSNIANVAMLWGIAFLMSESFLSAGICLGFAGLFHLNHALVGVGLWMAMTALFILRRSHETSSDSSNPTPRFAARLIAGGIILLALCLPNIIPPVQFSLTHKDPLGLSEFIFLYAKFRHPHHYDPSSWPLALWLSLIWPIPLAIFAWRRNKDRTEVQNAARIFLLLSALILIALIGAGIWYVSEPLIQMSLYRFSIFIKLLSCIGAASLLYSTRRRFLQPLIPRITAVVIFLIAAGTFSHLLRPVLLSNAATLTVLVGLMILASIFEMTPSNRWRTALVGLSVISLPAIAAANWLNILPGLQVIRTDDDSPDYLAVCDWARLHTPADAIFLVPPEEQAFRLRAERAIVVNFKGVPQFGAELIEWRDRLRNVLDLPDLRSLPRRFDKTLVAIGQRYQQLSPAQLSSAARRYGVSYIIADTGVITGTPSTEPAAPGMTLLFEKGPYRLYHFASQ